MTSRADLLRLLTEACELEHGLACSYLYSAMTLKQRPDEESLPAAQLPLVRQWASQVYFVASQEMLHLAQAWNLLTALGGTPYYLRPNFPQGTHYYPLHRRLALEAYGAPALERFVEYERPAAAVPVRAADDTNFTTIGELYDVIERGIVALPDAVIGDPEAQVGSDLIDFPTIVKVVDVDSAQRAIHLITHQGEGNPVDRRDCHFGIFTDLRVAYTRERLRNPRFEPAAPSLKNPAVDTSEDYGAPHATLIANLDTRAVAQQFDGLYSLMLRMLGYAFNSSGAAALRRRLGQQAIVLMATVLKPLGEALTHMPAAQPGGATAGPSFGLTRHVMLPANARAARLLVDERLAEITRHLETRAAAAPEIARVMGPLRRLAAIQD